MVKNTELFQESYVGFRSLVPPHIESSTYFKTRPIPYSKVNLIKEKGKFHLTLQGTRTQFTLNEQARAVWTLCDGNNTVEDIVETLQEVYSCDPRNLIGDVNVLLHQLYELGFAELWDPGHRLADESDTLDLCAIPTFVINCAEDTARKKYMETQLGQLGLDCRFVTGVKCQPRPIGIAVSHLKALRRQDAQPPFLVLEDDCEFHKLLHTKIKVPAAVDAVYLGVSKFGIPTPGEFGWGRSRAVRYYRYNPDYLRVLNMLSRHAVVFLTERYHQNAINASIRALTNPEYPYPGDIGYAMLQASHLVVTPNDPVCHQNKTLGGIFASTHRTIREILT